LSYENIISWYFPNYDAFFTWVVSSTVNGFTGEGPPRTGWSHVPQTYCR